jgi:predicted regulator of Ras-like GTPase activity (Roadblock/LC7/MglB family)
MHCASIHLQFAGALVLGGLAAWSPAWAASGVAQMDTGRSPANNVGQYSAIAIGADGLPVISYRDATGGTLKVAKCASAACTGVATITTVDDPATAGVGSYTAIAIGTDGRPMISYFDSSASALKVAHCADAACTGMATITTVDDPPSNDVGSYTSIAIGTDGVPVVSYNDSTAGALKVAKCANAACTGSATITAVDDPPTNSVGFYTSIAIGTDGLPVISYRDATAGALKVARCANAACTGSATITTVDDQPTNDLGLYTSIAIGTDGLPVISYFDVTAQALKVAHCGNAACSSGNTINTVDDPGNIVGEYTSIAIGTDGLPVISYHDSTAGALKVAHCANAACTGVATITTVDDPANAVGAFTSIAIGTDSRPVMSY